VSPSGDTRAACGVLEKGGGPVSSR
jgi:hypothetical protein